MAPTDELVSDAFGDFFFLGLKDSATQSNSTLTCPAGPSATRARVFTLPMRSKASSSGKQLRHNSSSGGTASSHSLTADANADATATLVLFAPKQAADRKLGSDTADMQAAADADRPDSKPETSFEERGLGRSTSLDTCKPFLGNRDQCFASDYASGRAEDCARPLSSLSTQDASSCLLAEYLAARRSGSSGGSSGGGAGPGGAHNPHHPHHGFWHSTEWWRSFSSSRLNEMAVEEPDKRSPEMRKVPFVGGAEPMCSLVHGEVAEEKPQ